MTITELIAKLEAIKAEHGPDVEVATHTDAGLERVDLASPWNFPIKHLRADKHWRTCYLRPDAPDAEGPVRKVLVL